MYFDEQAVQRCLVSHRARKGRVTSGLVGHRQPIEPGRPVLIEVPFDANFVRGHGSSFTVPHAFPLSMMVSKSSVAERESKDSTPKQ